MSAELDRDSLAKKMDTVQRLGFVVDRRSALVMLPPIEQIMTRQNVDRADAEEILRISTLMVETSGLKIDRRCRPHEPEVGRIRPLGSLLEVRANPSLAEPTHRLANEAEECTQIYFVQGETTGLIKIGRARSALHRFAGLQHASPDRLLLLWTYAAPGEHELELHRRFAEHRAHGEWFTPGKDLCAYIERRKPKRFPRGAA